MEFLHETKDYGIFLLTQEQREEFAGVYNELFNYGIMNKQYATTEAVYSVLFPAYEVMQELQNKLDESRPSHLRSVN